MCYAFVSYIQGNTEQIKRIFGIVTTKNVSKTFFVDGLTIGITLFIPSSAMTVISSIPWTNKTTNLGKRTNFWQKKKILLCRGAYTFAKQTTQMHGTFSKLLPPMHVMCGASKTLSASMAHECSPHSMRA